MKTVVSFLRAAAFAWLVRSPVALAHAQTGIVEGRVFNPRTGEYLERARVTIEGTSLQTFTDQLGQYSLNVPAGSAQVRVFYTGIPSQTASVTVTAGKTAVQDFTMGSDIVQLSSVTVSTSREMDGAAIAINEKPFAPDIRSVIAAEEFGPTADGNVG